jgi:delta-aminolevulinic acid dehydratase/porphobilinogen synthase
MENPPEYITIKQTCFLDHETTFSGKFSDIKRALDKLEKEGWEGIEYTCRFGSDVYDLYRHRLETDEEWDKRVKALGQKAKKEAIAKEVRRQRYETLRKEFEND